jgi:hypothetical protein
VFQSFSPPPHTPHLDAGHSQVDRAVSEGVTRGTLNAKQGNNVTSRLCGGRGKGTRQQAAAAAVQQRVRQEQQCNVMSRSMVVAGWCALVVGSVPPLLYFLPLLQTNDLTHSPTHANASILCPPQVRLAAVVCRIQRVQQCSVGSAWFSMVQSSHFLLPPSPRWECPPVHQSGCAQGAAHACALRCCCW